MSDAAQPTAVLVVGVGSLLRQDDGVGVHLVRALAGRLPPGSLALDAGTAPLDSLLPLVGGRRYDRLIVVDAMLGGGEPGTIYRGPLGGPAQPAAPGGPDAPAPPAGRAPVVSLHDPGLGVSLTLARLAGVDVGEARVVGVEPAELGWGTELSPVVAARLPALVAAVLAEIEGTQEARTCC